MSNKNSYIFTGVKKSCTGCGACVQACSHQALSMQEDDEGFLFPVINNDLCVSCGLCDIICPSIGNHHQNNKGYQRCYLSTTSRTEYYFNSASIGICTMIADKILSFGGHVFGVVLDETTWKAYHIEVENKNDIERIRNSKYLQSNTSDTFSKVKSLLLKNETVLYIGTPCQIAGIKSYLRKDYDNFYSVDIFCHGVFSPKLMRYEVKYWEGVFNGKVTNFRFRSKRIFKHSNGGMVNFDVEKGKRVFHVERYAGSSPSYRPYAYNDDGISYNLRTSCYNCSFRDQTRYGDISVGDPWRVQDSSIKNEELRSLNTIRSLFFVNTEKGESLFNNITDLLLYEEISVVDAFRMDALLPASREIPEKRELLYRGVNEGNYGDLVESLLGCELEKSHRMFVISYIKTQIKRVIKKIICLKIG